MTVTESLMKIFVVDDDPAARMLAKSEIVDLQADVREFADGESCLAAIAEAPDILVLDIEMPGTDGIAVCRAIRCHADRL